MYVCNIMYMYVWYDECEGFLLLLTTQVRVLGNKIAADCCIIYCIVPIMYVCMCVYVYLVPSIDLTGPDLPWPNLRRSTRSRTPPAREWWWPTRRSTSWAPSRTSSWPETPSATSSLERRRGKYTTRCGMLPRDSMNGYEWTDAMDINGMHTLCFWIELSLVHYM